MASGEVASTGTGNVSDLIATLRDRAPKVAMAAAAAQWVYPTVKQLRNKRQEKAAYTIKVEDSDDIYDDLHEWVLGLLPPSEQRALTAWTRRSHSFPTDSVVSAGVHYAQGGVPTPTPRVRLRYDGSRSQVINLGGHKIHVVVSEGKESKEQRWKSDEIVFTVHSLQAREALLAELNKLAAAVHTNVRRPSFRMLTPWGDWERLDDMPPRTLDSVILPQGQLDRLVADVQDFFDSESTYARRCQPWHRGHLYEGPPGTGKTSVAKAIASHFNMDVWYLPLSDVKKDSTLLTVVNRVGPRSMLLLEDIDVFHAASERNDEQQSATLSGLLNALDGVATPHGLFTVMTTNDMSKLDDAVLRPGRADLVEHFDYADHDQVGRLLSRWYDREVALSSEIKGLAPASVIEVCKRHEEDLGAALTELRAKVTPNGHDGWNRHTYGSRMPADEMLMEGS